MSIGVSLQCMPFRESRFQIGKQVHAIHEKREEAFLPFGVHCLSFHRQSPGHQSTKHALLRNHQNRVCGGVRASNLSIQLQIGQGEVIIITLLSGYFSYFPELFRPECVATRLHSAPKFVTRFRERGGGWGRTKVPKQGILPGQYADIE